MPERRFTKVYDNILAIGKSKGPSAYLTRSLICHLIRLGDLLSRDPGTPITIARISRMVRIDPKHVSKHVKKVRTLRPYLMDVMSGTDIALLDQALGRCVGTVPTLRRDIREKEKTKKTSLRRLANGRFAPSEVQDPSKNLSYLVSRKEGLDEAEPKTFSDLPKGMGGDGTGSANGRFAPSEATKHLIGKTEEVEAPWQPVASGTGTLDESQPRVQSGHRTGHDGQARPQKASLTFKEMMDFKAKHGRIPSIADVISGLAGGPRA